MELFCSSLGNKDRDNVIFDNIAFLVISSCPISSISARLVVSRKVPQRVRTEYANEQTRPQLLTLAYSTSSALYLARAVAHAFLPRCRSPYAFARRLVNSFFSFFSFFSYHIFVIENKPDGLFYYLLESLAKLCGGSAVDRAVICGEGC